MTFQKALYKGLLLFIGITLKIKPGSGIAAINTIKD
jgi:hypothetical protein